MVAAADEVAAAAAVEVITVVVVVEVEVIAAAGRVVGMVEMGVMPRRRTEPVPGHRLPHQGHRGRGLRPKGSHRDRRR